jgi:glycosyltransferase involved in cell wall biosynthesis
MPDCSAERANVSAHVSAIVPARNEAPCIAAVVRDLLALRTVDGRSLIGEVVVADNGSSDDTAAIARAAGARVVDVPQPGYGLACWDAVQASTGDVLLFVDGDGAADPADAQPLLRAIDGGAQLAIGVRCDVEPGALTFTQRFGNRLACALMRVLWRMPAQDLGPHRAIRRNAFDALDMRDRSFGWTVEMQVRAHLLDQRVAQVPGRWRVRAGGVSKISGTLRGVVGAGAGILGMIARLWWRERRRRLGVLEPVSAAAQPHRSASR